MGKTVRRLLEKRLVLIGNSSFHGVKRILKGEKDHMVPLKEYCYAWKMMGV
jgi:hypothetical protein